MNDLENDLRDLFEERARDVSARTDAPPAVLKRGRRRQVGMALVGAATALMLLAVSFAGLRAIGRPNESLPAQDPSFAPYTRSATVLDLTTRTPSRLSVIDFWPLGQSIAVSSATTTECSGSAVAQPSGNNVDQPSPDCAVTSTSPPDLPVYGVPVLQVSNYDPGLAAPVCGADLPADGAVLYLSIDAVGTASFSDGPAWPVHLEETPGSPCGPGMTARFRSPSGFIYDAWAGFGSQVGDDDREAILRAFSGMQVSDRTPETATALRQPGYVIQGGQSQTDGPWQLEVSLARDGVDLFLVSRDGGGVEQISGVVVPSRTELQWVGDSPSFGAVTIDAHSMRLRPESGEDALPATLVPLPASIASEVAEPFDLFFIENPTGLQGRRIEVFDAEGNQISPRPLEPVPTSTPDRMPSVTIDGSYLGANWRAEFNGPGPNCIAVSIDAKVGPCEGLAGAHFETNPALELVLFDQLAVFAGSVPTSVSAIRFIPDDGSGPNDVYARCRPAPLGWPQVNVCAFAMPPAASGTFEYLDAEGTVLYQEGRGWAPAK